MLPAHGASHGASHSDDGGFTGACPGAYPVTVGRAVPEVPGVRRVGGLGFAFGVVRRARVERDVGLHPVEAHDFFGVDGVGRGELGYQIDPAKTGNRRGRGASARRG